MEIFAKQKLYSAPIETISNKNFDDSLDPRNEGFYSLKFSTQPSNCAIEYRLRCPFLPDTGNCYVHVAVSKVVRNAEAR